MKKSILRELEGQQNGLYVSQSVTLWFSILDTQWLVEIAHGGTLFLDEIANISIETQSKLLRVLETHEYKPVGSDASKTTDVRLIAATNRNLEEMIRQGEFREDLYYRLNVFPIHIP